MNEMINKRRLYGLAFWLSLGFLLLHSFNLTYVDAMQQASTSTERMSSTPTASRTPICAPTRSSGSSAPTLTAPVRTFIGAGHVLRGVVRSNANCQPIFAAKLVFWLAGPDGEYGDAYTATIYTDIHGRYQLESNFPGQYDNVRPHIHMYVEARGHRAIETEFLPAIGTTNNVYNIVLRANS